MQRNSKSTKRGEIVLKNLSWMVKNIHLPEIRHVFVMEVLLVEIYPLKKWNFSSRRFYSVRSFIK